MSQQAKYTPGPWTIDPHDSGCIRDARDSVVVDCSPKYAHLIAAAPDMLEVLEGCLGYLQALPYEFKPDPAWLKPLLATIAKAKGE